MSNLQERIHVAFQFLKQAQPDIYNQSKKSQIEQLHHYFNLEVSSDDLDLYFQPTLNEIVEDLMSSIGDYYE
jgi:hypothetical protein